MIKNQIVQAQLDKEIRVVLAIFFAKLFELFK